MLDELKRIDAIVAAQCGRSLLTRATRVTWPKGLSLAPDVRAFYEAMDVVEGEPPVYLPLPGLRMLGRRAAIALWKELCDVADEDEDAAEFFDETGDDGRVRAILYHAQRFPIAASPNDPHYLLVDGVPGPKGGPGQVIFNRAESTFDWLAPSATALFDHLASQLETGILRFARLPNEIGSGFWPVDEPGEPASASALISSTSANKARNMATKTKTTAKSTAKTKTTAKSSTTARAKPTVKASAASKSVASAKPAKAPGNPKHDMALRLAADQGDAAAVKRALAAGAAVASADRTTGHTALHNAAMQGHLPIVKLLLAAGAPIEAELKNARTTPLGKAIDGQYHAVVRALLDAGARTEILYGRTQMAPLHEAAINEDPKTVALLLAAGAKPDFPNKYGRTALEQVVSMAGSLDKKAVTAIVRALVAAGADAKRGMKELATGSDGEVDEDVAYVAPLLAVRKG
jgi:cell wall assembly regulator SMI1